MAQAKNGIPALIGCCVSIFFVGAFIFGFPGVMGSYWQEIFHAGRGAIGQTLFFVLASLGIFMFLVGRWQEKYGARAMITIGVLLCSLDAFLIAYATNLATLYAWAFIMGLGSCFIYLPAVTCVQRWFPDKRGLVSGIVNFTFGFSAAIMSPVFAYLFKTVGYFYMNVMLGTIGLIVGLFAARFTEMPATIPEPGNPGNPRQPGQPLSLGRSLTVRESLRTRSFWFLWLTWALQGAASIAMVTLSTQFGLSLGFTLGAAVVILTAFNLTNGVSRLVMGWLSDVVGRNVTMSLTFLTVGCAYFVLPHVSGLALAALLAAIIGCGIGTLFSVSVPLASDCFGLKHFGAIFGLIFTAYGFAAGLLGPSLSGYILDVTHGNFTVVFTYLGSCCVAAGILIRFVVPPRGK